MIALLLLLILAGPAAAHDRYTAWQTYGGFSCCNQRDCKPVPYEIRADGIYLRLDSGWWRANQSEAREQQPLDDQAHACVLRGAVKPICFAKPWTGS